MIRKDDGAERRKIAEIETEIRRLINEEPAKAPQLITDIVATGIMQMTAARSLELVRPAMLSASIATGAGMLLAFVVGFVIGHFA